MFIDLTTLLPKRAHDHKIPLLKGNPPISMTPYKYAHFKKYIIEKLIQEMMLSSVIISSTISYASLVVLVKKKYGS